MAASNPIRRKHGASWPRGGRPGYRRRRPLPAISILVLLAIVAVVVWVTAVRSTSGAANAADCPAPPNGKSIGKPLPTSGLDSVTPIAPAKVPVRVLNSGSERGKATMVNAVLAQLGFSKTADPENDPAYQQRPLDCHGQIRFGPKGEHAARTLSLLDPCSQLIRDKRPGADVDMAIGKQFDDLRPSGASKRVLEQLAAAAHGDGGGVDHKLIDRAHDTSSCSD